MEVRARTVGLRIASLAGGLTAVAAVLTLVLVPHLHVRSRGFQIPLLIIAGGFALTEMLAIHVEVGKNAHSFSLTELPLVLGLFFCDPATVVVARAVGGLVVVCWTQRHTPLKITFNAGLFAFEGAIAVTVFHLALSVLPLSDLRAGWTAAFAASYVTNLASAAAITWVIRIATGEVDPHAFRTTATGSIIASTATTSLALMTVMLLLSDRASIAFVAIIALVLFTAYHGYTRLRQRYGNLRHLYDFTRVLAGSAETAPTIETTLKHACDLMRAGGGEISLIDGNAISTMRFVADDATLSLVAAAERTDAWPNVRAIAERTSVLLPRGSRDEGVRRYLDAHDRRDMVVAPLIQGDTVVGTIAVFDRLGEVSTFDREDANVFEALANHASVALENGRLIDRLRDEAAERAHQATHDSLTGLGNRRLFTERTTSALGAGSRRVGVLLLDLNRFKDVNDSLGHPCGDALLKEVALRLSAAPLPVGATIARLGGDEFAILVADLFADNDAVEAGESILRALDHPFSVEGLNIVISASVGIAISPDHGTDAAMLLQHADVAMYAAKDARSQEVRLYSRSLDIGAARRLSLAAELREALDAGALSMYFQPQANAASGEVRGMEALMRWRRDDGSWVSPEEFIPVAEHVGLIRPLTLFALKESVAQARAWHDAGTPVNVAVNLSVQSLIDARLPQDVREILVAARLDPSALTLEITESEVISDPARTLHTLDELRAIGVDLSVDDFGTGYSSMSYLQRLPIQEVKIDKSFVAQMLLNDGSAAIVRSIIDLGRNLRLQVVAEGVEDQATWDALADLGCATIQGYFLSKPIPGDQTVPWLAARVATVQRETAPLRSLPRSA